MVRNMSTHFELSIRIQLVPIILREKVCLSVPVLDKAASKQDGMHISWKSVKVQTPIIFTERQAAGSWQRMENHQ